MSGKSETRKKKTMAEKRYNTKRKRVRAVSESDAENPVHDSEAVEKAKKTAEKKDTRRRQKNNRSPLSQRYCYTDSGKRNSDWAQEQYRKIVREFDNYDLEKMLELIQNIPGDYEVHSALVFRSVVPAQKVEDWEPIKQQMEKSKMFFKCFNLREGIFCKSGRREDEENSTDGRSDDDSDNDFDNGILNQELQQLLDKSMNTRTYEDQAKFAIRYIESFYENIDNRSRNSAKESIYYYNNDDVVKEFPFVFSSLENSGLYYEKNPHIGKYAGINTPMFYLGAPNTFTAMHIEDGLTDSINILRSGAPKLWIIVEHLDYVKLNDVLCRHLYGDNKTSRPDIDYNHELCRLPTHHKNLMLTPKFLDDNDINYRFVMQYPGDAIFVRNAVAHQVWNVDENFAEATNYGSSRWKASNGLVMHCVCDLNRIERIRASTLSSYRILDRNQNKLANYCPLEGCAQFFGSTTEVEEHLLKSTEHKVTMYCIYCEKTSNDASNMGKHQKQRHGGTLKDFKFAHFCLRRLIELKYFENVADLPSNDVNLQLDFFLRIKRVKKRYDEILSTASEKHAVLSLLDEIHDMYANKHKCHTSDEAIAHLTKMLPKVQNFWQC